MASDQISSFIVYLVAAICSVACTERVTDPEIAMREFYSNPGPEDTLMDPLIEAGEGVVPLVLAEIENPDMPRRRYAIGFLGNEEVITALPKLRAIVNRGDERDYFRGDALIAIYKIDRSIGMEIAESFNGRNDYLGRMAAEVLEESEYANYRRSKWKALRRWHD